MLTLSAEEAKASQSVFELSVEDVANDPIPKVFAYFVEKSGKTTRYTMTPKRYRMAQRRWREEEAYQLSRSVKRENLRSAVSESFRRVIGELVASDYHRENGYVEWEQLFRSTEAFEKWLDRSENGYADHQAEMRRASR